MQSNYNKSTVILNKLYDQCSGPQFPITAASANTSGYNTHVSISHSVSIQKGSEAREPQPHHPLTATVVMVTIWKERPWLTLPSVVGSVRTSDINHPKQKWADLPLSASAPLFTP